jgi:hypothetical protein
VVASAKRVISRICVVRTLLRCKRVATLISSQQRRNRSNPSPP